MTPKPATNGPYTSARDLPSFVELTEQIRGAKTLTLFIGREHRAKIKDLETQLNALGQLVDDFYALLGDQNWIFHDSLNVEKVGAVVKDGLTPAEAEQQFIALYQDPEALGFLIGRLRHFPALASRLHLIKHAQADYEAGRYYSTVLVLITVMDGFVNDLVEDGQRRGLHTRDEDEMNAWDSVVGHHKGLTHAHKSFIKSFRKTVHEEVFELYRNGIVHGMILHYDNVIVATKAWNRLFAVADWAASREKGPAPAESAPTLRETLGKLMENQRTKEALDAWRPSTLSAGQADFETNEAFVVTDSYLSFWQTRNYGKMAGFIPKLLAEDTNAKTAGRLREDYELYPLASFEIMKLDFQAPAVCEVDVVLTIDGDTRDARLRWVKENDDGPVMASLAGEWHLFSFGPIGMINRATTSAT